ncbi:hypothetical protein Emag_007222 [Eimeria magna]
MCDSSRFYDAPLSGWKRKRLVFCLSLPLLLLGPVEASEEGPQQPLSAVADPLYRKNDFVRATGSVPMFRGLKSDVRAIAEAGEAQLALPTTPLLRGASRGPLKVFNQLLAIVAVLLLVFVAFCSSRGFTRGSGHGPQIRRLAGAWVLMPEMCLQSSDSDEESSDDEYEKFREGENKTKTMGSIQSGVDEDPALSSDEEWDIVSENYTDLSAFELDRQEDEEGEEATPPEPPGDPHDSTRDDQEGASSSRGSAVKYQPIGKQFDSTGEQQSGDQRSHPGQKPSEEKEEGEEAGAEGGRRDSFQEAASASQQPQPSSSSEYLAKSPRFLYSAFVRRMWTGLRPFSTSPPNSEEEDKQDDEFDAESGADDSSMYKTAFEFPLITGSDTDVGYGYEEELD